MMKPTPIVKGSIVTYKNGWYRVSALRGKKVNLKSVFYDKIYFKSVPVEDVTENEAAWYENWMKIGLRAKPTGVCK
jgi:hypothetical protein